MLSPSKEQTDVIEGIKNGDNIYVDAVAGSGKTTTVLSLAQLLTNKSIIQFTYNTELRREVKEKVCKQNIKNIDIFTYHSFAYYYYSDEASTDIGIFKIIDNNLSPIKGLPKIDIIVLDEIQDMMSLYYVFIYKVLFDLKNKVQLLILGDKYQGLYEFKGADTRFLTMANKLWDISPYNFIKKTLTTSYRVTRQIANFVNKCMIGKNRINAVKEGPNVLYLKNDKHSEVGKIVCRKLLDFLSSGYAKPEDIFILTPSLKKTTLYKIIENRLVDNNIPCYVPINDDSSLSEDIIKNKVIFSTFHQSKGRERKVVVVCQFDNDYFLYYNRCPVIDRFKCPSTLYVAATRATDQLIIIETSDPLPFLQYSHTQMKNSGFVDFPSIPLGIMNTNSKKELTQTFNKSSPSEIIKFIPNDTLFIIEELINQVYTLDVRDERLMNVKIPGHIPVYYNGVELSEEVSDINGITIPSLYEEKYTGSNTIKINVIKNQKTFQYKKYLKDIDFNNTSISESLLISNVYNSTNNGLKFKLAQIHLNNYNWLTPEMVSNVHSNMDIYMTSQKNIKFEYQISDYNIVDEETYKEMDLFIQEQCVGVNKIRFQSVADAVSDTDIWEFKCVTNLTLENKLQLIIYAWLWKMLLAKKLGDRKCNLMNIRTGELHVLNYHSPLIDEIMIHIIQAKFKILEVIDDAKFLKKCVSDVSIFADADTDANTDEYDL